MPDVITYMVVAVPPVTNVIYLPENVTDVFLGW
jgi:hypothetical protein